MSHLMSIKYMDIALETRVLNLIICKQIIFCISSVLILFEFEYLSKQFHTIY